MKSIVDLENLLVKPYIDTKDKAYAANIAPVETSPATSAHTAGTQIIYNGVLYDVTADIAANDVLTTTGVGANIAAADDVSKQISNVKQALSNQIGTGSKNLLPRPYASGNTLESGGITYTVNADGSVTASGTAAGANINFNLEEFNAPSILKKGTYIFSVEGLNNSNLRVLIGAGNSGLSAKYLDASNPTATFTITEDYKTLGFCVLQTAAAGATSGTVKMMIRDASISDSTYEPYYPQNKELLSADANAELGAHQFLDYDLAKLKALNTTGTWSNNVYTVNSVTFTVNSDLTITVNGTSSGGSYMEVLDRTSSVTPYVGKLISGITGGSASTAYLLIMYRDNNGGYVGEKAQFDADIMVTPPSGATRLQVGIQVANGVNVSSQIVRPLIRIASDPSKKCTPYAMTNKELTNRQFVERTLYSQSYTSSAAETYEQVTSFTLSRPSIVKAYVSYSNATPLGIAICAGSTIASGITRAEQVLNATENSPLSAATILSAGTYYVFVKYNAASRANSVTITSFDLI